MRIAVLDSGQKIVSNGLMLHLDAAQLRSYSGSGSTWTDLTTNGNNGTLNGTTFNTSNGGSISFNGSSDYVSFASLTNLNNPYASNEVWVYFNNPTAAVNEQPISRTNISPGTFNIIKSASFGGILACNMRDSTNTQVTPFSSVVPSGWVHIVQTYDGNSLLLYANTGVAVSQTISNQTINTGGTLNINLGRNASGVAYLNGRIAIARIYDRALSSTEVSQNYNATKSRFGL
jgi:hypothetical protein